MLTKSDLSQIKEVVRGELEGFATKDDFKNFATKDDLRDLRSELKNFATRDDFRDLVTRQDLKKELAPIGSDIVKIRQDIKVIVKFFDREYLDLRARVDQTEDHLGLAPL